MKIDPKKSYIMPLIMGPVFDPQSSGGAVYKEVQTVTFQYQTAPEAIFALLPDCYSPAKNPAVIIQFIYNDCVEFMAGRGYRIAAVMVAARYDGQQDHIEGNYVLVMFEDDTLPILLGRELLGISKLYADISPIKMLSNGHLRCEVSLWGHLLFGVDIDSLVKQDDSILSAVNEKHGMPLLGYKYISSLDGPPDAAYPISTPSENKLDQIWSGRSGRLFFGNPEDMDITFIADLIKALKTLSVCQVTSVSRSHGSSIVRGDLSRRLK